jgi:hypothetical protein
MSGTGADITTLLTSVKDGMLDQIGGALPIAGAVFAAVAGIMIGVKLFKKITGARS